LRIGGRRIVSRFLSYGLQSGSGAVSSRVAGKDGKTRARNDGT
jgi:hypothetical protein